MRSLAPLLVLLAVPAPAAFPAEPDPAAAADPAPAYDVLAAPDAAAAPPGTAEAAAPVVPSQAVVEKLGYGDRLFLAGEYRNALFAYLDAVYLEPRHAPARVKLGRAYLALRYPQHAITHAEAALALDPANEEARALLEEARNVPERPVAPAAAPH